MIALAGQTEDQDGKEMFESKLSRSNWVGSVNRRFNHKIMASYYRNRKELWLWLCRRWKNGLDSWGTCRGHSKGAAGPKSQNGKMNCNEVYQYSNTMLFFISTFVLRAENWGVCCGSDLGSQTELRNGLDFETLLLLREFFRQWALFVKSRN